MSNKTIKCRSHTELVLASHETLDPPTGGQGDEVRGFFYLTKP